MLTKTEYERRFKERIVKRLLDNGETGPNSGWTLEEATEAANDEFAAFIDNYEAESNPNPEDDADECLSYWDADE